LRNVRGWSRIANLVAEKHGRFVVSGKPISFEGDLGAHIDREVYLYGAYERDFIQLFIDVCPDKSLVLDIGANVGNHSVLFAEVFRRVEAFEPNGVVWEQFEKNARMNGATNVTLHRIGLSDERTELPLYSAGEEHLGLATFVKDYPYGRPVRITSVARIEVLDDYLPALVPSAVKMDVQGFEPNVLRGMRGILERSKPVVWVEFGAATLKAAASRKEVQQYFPYPIRMEKFVVRYGLLTRCVKLVPWNRDEIESGDYLVFPI
jgi:FkbM family methyltransferase